MKLKDLEPYKTITIQCHDNPDGDAIGAGYALYAYFSKQGKKVSLIYSGELQIQKSNLVLLVENLEIPIRYVPRAAELEKEPILEGLLITVDCQYGAGNVTRFPAETVAIIDHHQIEAEITALTEIRSYLGSCSTLVWKMMKEEGISFKEDIRVGTALYYGLYMDTNQFAEIHNPLDMDMREDLIFNNNLITRLRNSNLSLKELEIAGIALIRYIYNDDYEYAIIKSQPCDPNLLGLISDFLLQVDAIQTCIVYNEGNDGYKISVRSCSKEVRASELAAYITKGIGTGGGHFEKAGGFISKKNYEAQYPTKHTEAYFREKINEYFDNTDIIYAREYAIETSEMKTYLKLNLPLGHMIPDKILPIGTPITIRTQEGDIDLFVEENSYVVIGIRGEIYLMKKEKFRKMYESTEQSFSLEAEYKPTIKNRMNGDTYDIMDYLVPCVEKGKKFVYAKELTRFVKVFTIWNEEKYLSGKPKDYIAVNCEDKHDIYVVERKFFFKAYKEVPPYADKAVD